MMDSNRSEHLFEEAQRYIPSGVTSSIRKNAEPILFFKNAYGPFFVDFDEKEYLDYTLAWGPLILGSNHPAINAHVTRQLSLGYTFGAPHELTVNVAKKIIEMVPGVESVLFSNTGTEAIQSAIRIARAYSNKEKILKFEGHYHGWANNVLVSYKSKIDELGKPVGGCKGQPKSEFSDTLILPWNDLIQLEKFLSIHHNEIACIISEPILANSGSCMPEVDFLQNLVLLCRKYRIVSIFDEVITGFRIAKGGAREYFNVIPDISVYGKAIAGGFCLSALGGSKEIFRVISEGVTIHSGTYNGSPINLAAAEATLDVLSEDGCFEKMHQKGDYLKEVLKFHSDKIGVQVSLSGVGTVFSLHFGLESPPKNYKETLESDEVLYKYFRKLMLKEGILLLPDGRWYIGSSHKWDDIYRTEKAIERVYNKI